jgi:hypothetical protein
MRTLRIWDDANNRLKMDIKDGSIVISADGLRFEYHDDEDRKFVFDKFDNMKKEITLKVIK